MSPILSYSGTGRGGQRRDLGGERRVGRGRGSGGGHGRAGSFGREFVRDFGGSEQKQRPNKWVRPAAAVVEGNNLVGKREDTSKTNAEEKHLRTVITSGKTTDAIDDRQLSAAFSVDEQHQQTTRNHVNVITKMGHNRLVLKNTSIGAHAVGDALKRDTDHRKDGGETDPSSSLTAATSRKDSFHQKPTTMMKTGKNKLVAVHVAAAAFKIERPAQSQSFFSSSSSVKNTRKSKMKRPLPNRPPPNAAKRIKLVSEENPNNSQQQDGVDGHDRSSYDDRESADVTDRASVPTKEEQNPETEDQMKNVKLLSDFAYRQTSRTRQRQLTAAHGHLQWKKTHSCHEKVTDTDNSTLNNQPNYIKGGAAAAPGPRNMGLARVRDDTSTTPVCPTFLRGIPCEDLYCRRRHDVSKEHTMPVCSFFQKHGQCLRGIDCTFQHVKINPRATICPSFDVLGYCEDSECKMQHVRRGGAGGGDRSSRSVNSDDKYNQSKPPTTTMTKGRSNYKYNRKSG